MDKTTQNMLSQLKDIKAIVAIPDSSLYIVVALALLLAIALAFGLYKYFTRVKRTKKISAKEAAFKRLQNLDSKDTKELLYRFSLDGIHFVNEGNRAEFEAIERELEPYKYKKQTQELPKELEQRVKKFIKGLKYVA